MDKNYIWLYTALAAGTVLVGVYVFFGPTDESGLTTTIAVRGDIQEEVLFTGTVIPAERVNLSFERGGRLARITVNVGDPTSPGTLLAVLENGDILARLKQAEADLEGAESTLRKLEQGVRPEEIQIQNTKIYNRKIARDDAKVKLADSVRTSLTETDNVIADTVDQLFSNPESSNPSIIFITDFQSKVKMESSRVHLGNLRKEWKKSLASFDPEINIFVYANEARVNLNAIVELLTHTSEALENAIPSAIASEAIIASWLGEVGTARTSIDVTISSLSKAEEALNTAESNLSLANNELDLLLAGSEEEDLNTQRSVVRSKQAQVDVYEAELSKTMIRSPIAGIVAERTVDVGETISANTTALSVISRGKFQIEADIPESDVVKIELGDKARITLDAYGDDAFFDSVVTIIDPAETVIEGVPTYTTTLQFTKLDERIRSGMTANAVIVTDERKDVVYIPSRAVLTRENGKIVRVLTSTGSIKEVPVVTGLRSSEGSIEIIEGINEGDEIVVLIKE